MKISKSIKQTIIKNVMGLFVSDVYSKAFFDNFNKDRSAFGVTDKGMAHTESLTSILKILKYHFVLFMAGVIITVYAITTIELSIVPLVNIGWIWYNNSWLILAIIFAKLKIPEKRL